MRIARIARALAPLALLAASGGCAGKIEVGGDAPDASSMPSVKPGAPRTALTTTTPLVDWGYLSCGTAAGKSAHLENVGASPIRYTLSIEGDAFALVGASSGSLAPGASMDVALRVTVPKAAAPRRPLEGALSVDLGEGASLRVRLRAIPDGAVLSLVPSAAAFGPVLVGDIAAPIHVAVANVGYAPVRVAFALPKGDGFGLSWTLVPAAFELSPQQIETVHATFAPTSIGAKRFDAALMVEGPLCGDVPAALTLIGEGVPAAMDAGTPR